MARKLNAFGFLKMGDGKKAPDFINVGGSLYHHTGEMASNTVSRQPEAQYIKRQGVAAGAIVWCNLVTHKIWMVSL